MFSSEPHTPRPRPPGLTRRSKNAYSPSSRIDEFLFLSTPMDNMDPSDPVHATAQMLGVQIDSNPELSPTRIAEVSEKSREELANLFLEAEKVIVTREAELAVAANLGKTLLETNQILKTRHDALVARLPVMQVLPTTPTLQKGFKMTDGDPWTTDDEIPSASNSARHAQNDFKRGHQRRISASPSALQALSETNAELIAELTRLREETEAAQKDGASRLRKLEREMSALRGELEETQKMNVELEGHMNTQREEEERTRAEREGRLKKMRETKDPLEQEERRDFAPSGQGAEAWDAVGTSRTLPDLPSDYRRGSISPGEYTLVSQLLGKVEELQAANRDIRTRHQATQEEFARAERNALEIKRMYDTIREEMGSDADGEMSDDDYRHTIRPRSRNSLRLSLRSPAKSLTPRSSMVSLKAKRSTDEGSATAKPKARALGNKHMFKMRKPLTESLFVPPSASRPTPPPTPPISATHHREVLSRSPSPREAPKVRHSLGSELGSFPGAWDIEASSRAHLNESKKLEESFDEIMGRLGLSAEEEDAKSDDRASRRERALQRMLTKKEGDMGGRRGATCSDNSDGLMDILRRTSVEALVELWIILQFIVVICFFIYTMTKRGPRDVMGIPPRKR